MKEIKGKIKYLINKNKSFKEICEELNLKDYEFVGLIELMKNDIEPELYENLKEASSVCVSV